MKLNYFSEQTYPRQRYDKTTATVTFMKGGIISFNPAACRLIGLTAEDKISFCQDEDSPADWYFFIDKKNGFNVRDSYDKKGILLNHAALVKTFLDCFDLDHKTTYRYLLAGKPTLVKSVNYWNVLVTVEAADEIEEK